MNLETYSHILILSVEKSKYITLKRDIFSISIDRALILKEIDTVQKWPRSSCSLKNNLRVVVLVVGEIVGGVTLVVGDTERYTIVLYKHFCYLHIYIFIYISVS